MTSKLSETERQLLDLIADKLAQIPRDKINPRGIEEAARLAVAALRSSGSLDELVGPTCSTTEISKWWGVSRQAIHKAITNKRLLAVQDGRRTWHFPTWQLRPHRTPIEGLSPCLEALVELPAAAVAAWFIRPNAYLDNQTPAQWLIDSQSSNTVQLAARKYAAAYKKSGAR